MEKVMSPGDHAIEIKAGIAKAVAYSTSGGLVFADYMEYLNHHAGAFGVIIGFCTFIVNWIYQHKNRKLIKKEYDIN